MKDLISRQAAITAICEHGVGLERRGILVLALVEHKQMTIDLLESLPSAQPEILACGEGELVIPKQQWVPVSEGLPGYGEDVLVSVSGYCNVGHIVPTNDEKQYNWYYSGWYHDPYDVDAWMPLPEPWKGENDG